METGIIQVDNKKFLALVREVDVLKRKIANPQVPSGKKEKIAFRLEDIRHRIIPKTISSMSTR